MIQGREHVYDEMTASIKAISDSLSGFENPMPELFRQLEERMVSIAMRVTDGNCAKAAMILGINRSTLVEKRRKLDMPLRARSRPCDSCEGSTSAEAAQVSEVSHA